MGWLWASSTPNPPKDMPEQSPTPPPPPPPPAAPAISSGDSEITKFFAELQADHARTSSTTSTAQPPSSASSPASSSSATIHNNTTDARTSSASSSSSSSSSSTSSISGTLSSYLPFLAGGRTHEAPKPLPPSTSRNFTPGSEALAHSLRPSDMSCRQAFDQAYACQSIGGQWNAIYREGSVRTCSHLWEDFWFCMRVKGYVGPMKEEAIKEHYRRKELEKYGGKPNSEDVWVSRDEKVPPGTAFKEPFVPDNMSDEEWQLMEIERRKQIRRELGIE